jgi:uncharacterized radical SAM superfamily Fe-S cluster-containing enzyme
MYQNNKNKTMITNREAIKILESLDEGTIIDANWFTYLIEGNTLIALFKITDLNSYQEILDKYEGYSINELLNEILNKN